MTPDEIAAELRADLLSGRLRPGAELQQTDLAERFAVSRIPIRDALRALAADGLVTIKSGRGASVVMLSAAEVEELYDLRILLECDCLDRATKVMTSTEIEAIDRLRKKADLDAATPAWADSDWAFHEALYRPAARPRQLALIHTLRQTCRMLAAAHAALPTARAQWLDHHKHIVDQLRDGNAAAAVSTLRRHIEGARDHLLAAMSRPSEAG